LHLLPQCSVRGSDVLPVLIQITPHACEHGAFTVQDGSRSVDLALSVLKFGCESRSWQVKVVVVLVGDTKSFGA